MPSASYNQVQRIVAQAYENAGLIEDGDEPNSEQFAKGMNRLNDIIGVETTHGLKLWPNQDTTVSLTANKATYTLGPGGNVNIARPMRVANNEAYYLDTSGNQRPLLPLSRDDYTRLSQRTQQGAINSFFYDPQQTLAIVAFWNTPDSQAATGTAHLILQIPISYVSSLLDQINFPQEWYMFLHWALADDISTGQPMSIMSRCQQKAEQYRKMLEDWDVEQTDTQFQPDLRGGYGYGSFG